MKTYLILNRVRVQHANSMVSWNVVGAPPITAHLGFAKAIAFHHGLEANAVAVLHHGMEHEGRYSYGTLTPNRVRGVPLQVTSKQPKIALSDQPFSLSHYEFSMVVEIQGDQAEIWGLRDMVVSGNGHDFIQNIQGMFRVAGGSITSVSSALLSDFRTEALDKLPRVGHFVIDASSEMYPRHDQEDVLDRAIEALYSNHAPTGSISSPGIDPQGQGSGDLPDGVSGEGKSVGAPRSRWLALSSVGYLRLTEVQNTPGSRQGLPHAYAETLLGLVEYLPYRQAVQRNDLKPFWSFTHPAPDVIVAKALS